MSAPTLGDSAGTLPPGLHVVAGHTGGGKTAFAIGLARAALKAGHPVVYLSLELSRREIVARLVGLEAHELHPGDKAPIPWGVLAHGGARRPEQDRKVGEAIQAVRGYSSGLRVWAPDGLAADCDQLREIVRACDVTPLVVVDYLQAPGLQAGGGRDLNKPLRERLGAVIMALRHTSKANGDSWPGCPVLVLSTTARSNVKGAEGTPGMSGGDPDELRRADLEALKALPKEAGEIEATAVTSWAWAKASEDDPDVPKGEGERVTLRLAKSRAGRAGQWVPLTFYGGSGKLEDARERYGAAEEADKERKEARKARARGDK
jgi:replicative DNA helicase